MRLANTMSGLPRPNFACPPSFPRSSLVSASSLAIAPSQPGPRSLSFISHRHGGYIGPSMVMKYEDLQHLGSEEKNQEIRKAPPPQVGLWYICSEHRLILLSLGLNFLLLVAVCVIGSQTRSLNQKVVSVESSLQKQEQDFKAGQSEVVLQVQRLTKNVISLNYQLAILKNNGSAKTCCPLDWLEHECSCYWFSQSGNSWPEADKYCQLQNSHLVVVTSLEEQKFIEKHMGSEPSWMGLTDQNGPWRWVDGTDYERGFKYWSPNQPDDWTEHGLGGGEDCASFSSDGRWNDDVCQRPFSWICEIELGKTS
ncbi:hypothetical protein GHT09_012812 [Marmota monax]|uniref:C-type lectin domain-containing protein n=1 Tax=Marmota monax TaxID=9995 RepID=A0A834QFS6_MARMO|nr:hypothetical protein GHT09_012812 [Marmota monax]